MLWVRLLLHEKYWYKHSYSDETSLFWSIFNFDFLLLLTSYTELSSYFGHENFLIALRYRLIRLACVGGNFICFVC